MNNRQLGLPVLLGGLLLAAGCTTFRLTHNGSAAPRGMAAVDQGVFTMGADGGDINERPEHDVFLSLYHVDLYEVSAAEFAAFLNARGNEGEKYFSEARQATVVRGADGLWQARAGFEKYPANNVSWHGASAYCEWAGKRLPTEAEWEKAARGEDRRPFPWGDEPPGEMTARFGRDPGGSLAETLAPVDSLPQGASPYGLHHTAGNVWEWVGDWYRQHYCNWCDDEEGNLAAASLLGAKGVPPAGSWTERQEALERLDPAGPEYGSFKVLRGGSWIDDEDVLRTTVRYWRLPADRGLHIGFRCASDPGQ